MEIKTAKNEQIGIQYGNYISLASLLLGEGCNW
jgi:hypothetical protein